MGRATTTEFSPCRGLGCDAAVRSAAVALAAVLVAVAAGCGGPKAGAASEDAIAPDSAGSDTGLDIAGGTDDDATETLIGDGGDATDDATDDTGDGAAPTDAGDGDAAWSDTASEVTDADTPGDTGQPGDGGKPGDADAAVEDVGAIGKSVHATACSSAADCSIPCASGACVQGKCSYVVKGNVCLTPYGSDQVACYGAGLADDVTPCLACAPQISAAKLSAVSGIAALNATGEGVAWEDTASGGIGWGYDSKRSVSGGASLYFGDPVLHTYANGKHVAGAATLPPLPVPQTAGVKPTASFWVWMDTEASAGFDFLVVNILDGAAKVPVWSSDPILGTTHGAWQRVTFDVSAFAGKKLTLQFVFDSVDAQVNAFEGVYIDQIEVSTGCCAAASDCDDGDACSADTCEAVASGVPGCLHTAKIDCCNTPAQCNDGLPCTLDLCPVAGGGCQHSAKVDCCMQTADCDDGDACTVDDCSGPGGACKHQNTCCKTDAECKSADSCFAGSCSAGQCVFQSVCCQKDDDCDDFNPCTKDACTAGKCAYTASTAPGCCAPTVLSASFDGSDGGFAIVPFAVNGVVNNPTWYVKDTADSVGGKGVLAFGVEGAAAYSVAASGKPKATATSPYLTLLGGKEASLSFSYRADTPSTSLTLRVAVEVDGADVTLISKGVNSGTTNWQTVTIDLSALAGKSFPVHFEVSYSSSFGNITNTQVYLDNVHVDSTCQPKKCAATAACAPSFALSCYTGVCSDGQCTWPYSCCDKDGDCNDNGLCTTDKCVNKKCQFQPIKNCCMGAGDCNDGSACTIDSCAGPGADCQFAPIAGCCLTSAMCDDKIACTADACIKNVCSNVNTCCSVDKDCDDGETKCTTDTCVGQKCQHKPTGAAGCCNADTFSNDFDLGDAKGITFSGGAGAGKGWQLWLGSTQVKSGTGVLYYGDPSTGNFDFGATSGGAKTLPILLAADVNSKLEFDLFMQTEQGPPYDALQVNLYVNGAKTQLWDKNSNGYTVGAWKTISIDLAKWIGQEVQIEFFFNTVDSIGNSGFGVAVDNLKVIAACP